MLELLRPAWIAPVIMRHLEEVGKERPSRAVRLLSREGVRSVTLAGRPGR